MLNHRGPVPCLKAEKAARTLWATGMRPLAASPGPILQLAKRSRLTGDSGNLQTDCLYENLYFLFSCKIQGPTGRTNGSWVIPALRAVPLHRFNLCCCPGSSQDKVIFFAIAMRGHDQDPHVIWYHIALLEDRERDSLWGKRGSFKEGSMVRISACVSPSLL